MFKKIICILACFGMFGAQDISDFASRRTANYGVKWCLRAPMACGKGKFANTNVSLRTGRGAQKVQRVRFLLNSLSEELRKRNLVLNIELHGVIHGFRSTGIEYVIENADFVTLELPNSTVKNYFEKGPRSVNIWNEFWLGTLRELKKKRVFGVNDSAIRYPRRRLHFYNESQIGRGKYIQFGEDRKYDLRGLGQRKKEKITGRELLAHLPDDIRVEFQSKKVVHILPQKNPFGKKHLVLFKPVSDSILQLSERLKKVLLEEFRDLGVRDEDILEIFNMHVVEPLLCIYNDYDQIERMLERVRKSIKDHDIKGKEGAKQALRLVHIGGAFHNSILQKYLTMDASSDEITVETSRDSRFRITAEDSPNPKFLESIGDILEHIYFSGSEYEAEVDVEYFTDRITGIIRDDKDFFRRRILLAAIFDKARLAGRIRMTEPGKIKRKYGKEELMLEKSIVSELLYDLSLDELKQLNAALEKRGRIYKTSHRWILREIVNQGIMDPGEIAVYYVNRRLLQDPSFMQSIYIGTNYYKPEQDKWRSWFSPYFSDLIFKGCSPEQRIKYEGEEMIAEEAKKKIEELRDKEEVFVTVIYTYEGPMEIEIGRRRHGISKAGLTSRDRDAGQTLLRQEMAFGKGGAESHFITHQKDKNGSDVWRVPAWYAEPRVAPELVDLFSAAEKLKISRFKIGGGTARDFCLGMFFGIRTIDKSSDIDVIIPGIEKFDNLWDFLEEFQKIAMGKRGLERFPCIDTVLGWAPPKEKLMVYESLYAEGDLSITKLVVEKEQGFYIITDSYGGVSDIWDKILRFVNMTDAQFSAGRVMDRYIPYFAKLKQYGFKYEPASKKRIDDFLQEGRFNMTDILRGINSVFDKAGNSDAAFAALQEFKLLDILERQTEGLDAHSDSNIISELRGFIGRARNREAIDPEALSDFIERLCKAIEGRSGVSDVYRQAL